MWIVKKGREAVRALRVFARPYRGSFALGTFGTVIVVLMRLAIPWPLKGIIEVVFPDTKHPDAWLQWLPSDGRIVWLGVLYIACAAGTGIGQLIQRVNMRRFAAHTVHDMRAAAVRSLSQQPRRPGMQTGDLIARIIGDTARIKAGISGVLVHVTQNGLLFVGVCVLMLWISPWLGLFFLVPGLIVLLYGFRTGNAIAEVAEKQREKEGEYAEAIQEGILHGGLDPGLEDINMASTRKSVRTTVLMARAGLVEHMVLALGVAAALLLGAEQARRGTLAPGNIFLFIAYALMVHRRMIQIGRQTARSGKILANVNRVYSLITEEGTERIARVQVPLRTELVLEGVKLHAARGWGRKDHYRLKMPHLSIAAGTRVVVIGTVGAGKSSLLRVLAGIEPPDKGQIRWDDEDITGSRDVLLSRVGYLPQDPVFPPKRLWQVVGLDGPDEPSPSQQDVLEATGAGKIIRKVPNGLRRRVAPTDFTRNQVRVLALAGLILHVRTSVWVMDNPLEGLRGAAARRCLEAILQGARERTLVVALSRAVFLDRFDRILLVKNGRLSFDGSPQEWDAYRSNKKKKAQAL